MYSIHDRLECRLLATKMAPPGLMCFSFAMRLHETQIVSKNLVCPVRRVSESRAELSLEFIHGGSAGLAVERDRHEMLQR
jgi:hypothetical protein